VQPVDASQPLDDANSPPFAAPQLRKLTRAVDDQYGIKGLISQA
jgi:hypothetical protein